MNSYRLRNCGYLFSLSIVKLKMGRCETLGHFSGSAVWKICVTRRSFSDEVFRGEVELMLFEFKFNELHFFAQNFIGLLCQPVVLKNIGLFA